MRLDETPVDTESASYAARLERLEGVWWKRLLDVQAPYRWYLARLRLGRTLDVGCGLGRHLAHLDGVGVDHNPQAVAVCRRRGLEAYVPEEFAAADGSFDSILMAHVVEHMTFAQSVSLIELYRPYLRPEGRLVLITPQQAGFRSDETHVEYVDDAALDGLLVATGFTPQRRASFPLPRWCGRWFKYNEFVAVGVRS